ncbi:MAG: hypothetical protein KIS67_01900 [Verrucomicrobiae bacterium]|nr:hypothetical protein [Verrucomicrobiae bacterium]
MKPSEEQTIRRAIALLSSMIDTPQECLPAPWHSPVRQFVEKYLCPDPQAELASEEAWTFFQEIVQAGELAAIRRAVFLRQLPTIVEAVYGLRKSHHVERSGRRVRGFKGIAIRGGE